MSCTVTYEDDYLLVLKLDRVPLYLYIALKMCTQDIEAAVPSE